MPEYDVVAPHVENVNDPLPPTVNAYLQVETMQREQKKNEMRCSTKTQEQQQQRAERAVQRERSAKVAVKSAESVKVCGGPC